MSASGFVLLGSLCGIAIGLFLILFGKKFMKFFEKLKFDEGDDYDYCDNKDWQDM